MHIKKLNQDTLIETQEIESLSSSSISSAEEKYEKHLKNSESILSQVLTPYEAFKEGFEKAIASYIKLGQEEQIKNKIVSGPQAKSEETQLLEKMIKSLLDDFDSVKFIKKEERYLALFQGKIYQFSRLIEKVNFNQMELSESELNAYHELLNSGSLYQKTFLPGAENCPPTKEDFEKNDPENLCSGLTLAEKEALNIYTGSYYHEMNSLMRGAIDEAISSNLPQMLTPSAQINHSIKETLLHIAVAVCALNKLPDYIPPLREDGKSQKYLYRGEYHLPTEALNKRKIAVLQGGGITTEVGFISTAFEKPALGFFGAYAESGVMIKNLKGKKITPLSQMGNSEREILLPPTQMQWLYHKDVITDVFQHQISLFIAKPVTVAPELTIDFKPYTIEDWLVKNLEDNDPLLSEINLA